MINCKQCGKEVPQKEGRREKMYCDYRCKSAWFTKNRPKYKAKNEKLPKGVTALRAIVGYAFDIEQIPMDKVEQFQETHPQKYIRVEALTLEGYNKNPLIKTAIDALLSELVPNIDDRTNKFTNAARGRDSNGVNNDEIRSGKPVKMIGESSIDFNIRLAEWKEKQGK